MVVPGPRRPVGPNWSRAALIAGTPWLDVFCAGCRTSRAIDLRTADRHPFASVGTLVLVLRLLVSGLGANAEPAGLYALPPGRGAQSGRG
jgi:hypothetical protein